MIVNMGCVVTAAYAVSDVDRRTVMAYAGGGADIGVESIVDECIADALPELSYNVCFTKADVSISGSSVSLGGVTVMSASLAKRLRGCGSALIFAATVGFGIDRLIMRYSAVSPVRALIFQAIGAERIEALCDEFCLRAEKEYGTLRARFSPGYGDLPLTFQREIFAMLGCSKRIGISLNESLLMSPTKSVTAVVGIEK